MQYYMIYKLKTANTYYNPPLCNSSSGLEMERKKHNYSREKTQRICCFLFVVCRFLVDFGAFKLFRHVC